MVQKDSGAYRMTGHLAGLDGVRGLAILMVMTNHFVGGATPHTAVQRLVVKAANYGVLGVDLFFVLSGFLITGLLFDAKNKPHYFRNFYARRSLRIFPLYYFVLTMLFLLLPNLVTMPEGIQEARRHQVWLWTYTTNFYIASKSSWGALTYVNHFWSLAIEEHFYLLWPFVVFSFGRRTLERVCIGVMVGALALRIGLSLAGVSELSIFVLTPCRVDALCAGGLLALRARCKGGAEMLVHHSARSALVLGSGLVLLSGWCVATNLGIPVFHPVRTSLYALFFGALLLMSLDTRPNLVTMALQSQLLRFFGKYSYGLYVYHGLLTWYLIDLHAEERCAALVGNHAWAILITAVVGAGVSVFVAVLSYHLLEKRFLALKKFFEARERAPSAQVAMSGRATSDAKATSATPRATGEP
jgi:peptidoglycan/LPS O-acetylase OafA/YrhL